MGRLSVVGFIEGFEFLVLFLLSFGSYSLLAYFVVGDFYQMTLFITPSVAGYWGLLSIMVFRGSDKHIQVNTRLILALIGGLFAPFLWMFMDEPWVTLTLVERGLLHMGAMIGGLVLFVMSRCILMINTRYRLHG